MGNFWKGISDDDLLRSELALLRRAGFTQDEFTLRNVRLGGIDDDDSPPQMEDSYVHHVEIRSSQVPPEVKLPIMVIVHGYGAGGCLFYRVFKGLARHFHIYVVDLLGMGSSGRPPFPTG